MVKNLFLLLTIATAVFSCKKPDKEIEFRYVTNVQVKKVTGEEVLLTADALFYNPNNMKMKLREIDVDVFLTGNKIGEINQEIKTTIPALADFKVPFDAVFNIRQVGGIGTLLSIMGGRKLQVRYDGHIKVTVHGLPFKVPVDYENEFSFR